MIDNEEVVVRNVTDGQQRNISLPGALQLEPLLNEIQNTVATGHHCCYQIGTWFTLVGSRVINGKYHFIVRHCSQPQQFAVPCCRYFVEIEVADSQDSQDSQES